MPESNSQQKSTQMIASATSKWGLNREEQAAVLRVRTRPECPECNWRELMWDSNLNCGIARERERINRWKAPTEHTVTPSQNKGRTEQFQRRTGQGWTGPSPTGNRRQGGGERGKHGPRDGIPYQTANRLPVSNQRLPETLDGWHLLGGSQPEISFPEGTQGAPDRCTGKLRLGPWRGWGALHPGGSVPVKLLAAWAARAGKAKNTGPTESASLWRTQEPEPEGISPRKCTQLRARPL